MKKIRTDNLIVNCNRKGIALVFALIVLAVLTTIAYSLVSKISMRKHRLQYLIDYQQARYACDSATRYAMARVNAIKPKYAERVEQPDFSDLFWMDDEAYYEYRANWAAKIDEQRLEAQEEEDAQKQEVVSGLSDMLLLFGLSDANSLMDGEEEFVPTEPNTLKIPGPYGPEWPLIEKPTEIEIGDAKVTIRIEDENAKLPVTLAFLEDEEIKREKDACFMTFFEWMGAENEDVEEFMDSAKEIAEIKPFKFKMDDIKTIVKEEIETTSRTSRTSSRDRRTRRPTSQTRYRTKTETRSALKHFTDFANLMNSKVDKYRLSLPVLESDEKNENMLKYLGVYGSQKVNINSAPRHVLEAIFTFGGDADVIAEEIITKRQESPFKDIEDLRSRMYGYSDSFDKVEDKIITESLFFTINIEARVGNAKAKKTIAILKAGKVVQRLATTTN